MGLERSIGRWFADGFQALSARIGRESDFPQTVKIRIDNLANNLKLREEPFTLDEFRDTLREIAEDIPADQRAQFFADVQQTLRGSHAQSIVDYRQARAALRAREANGEDVAANIENLQSNRPEVVPRYELDFSPRSRQLALSDNEFNNASGAGEEIRSNVPMLQRNTYDPAQDAYNTARDRDNGTGVFAGRQVDEDQPSRLSRFWKPAVAAGALLATTGLGAWWALSSGEENSENPATETVDVNGDGASVDIDLNGDGQTDELNLDTNGDNVNDAIDVDGDGRGEAFDTDGDGEIDAFDLTGDGSPNPLNMDTNGDGVNDAVDLNDDGQAEAYDTNGDKLPDAFDTNGNGQPNMFDRNGDGRPESFDTNGDGQPDAIDADGDGQPDAVDANADGQADVDADGNNIPFNSRANGQQTPQEAARTGSETYNIVRGDTLSEIAVEQYGDEIRAMGGGWNNIKAVCDKLAALNDNITDIDLIYAGDNIQLPATLADLDILIGTPQQAAPLAPAAPATP